ncbi:hypothetical protein [Halobacterium litoreum]|uniref:Outer membrane lipoprotein-sorting protein n=1 Tax=Halobacterium litoreum TaxID=2039234 RepID=A0ABD5NCB8_9EURY|nr:hypothetical protein [Halobacterium litoreum]UHH14178.1 hypothetical protein LT972_04055 [Halobacterium litoreum]
MRDALPAVAVVALLVLAGCSGASAPSDPTATGTTTDAATTDEPTTSPATTTQSAASGYPPGVSADGVENASALAEAHRASVVERGAVLTATTRTNGTVNNRTVAVDASETARLTANASELRWSVSATTTRGNATTRLDERYYANESTLVSRVEREGNVTVRSRNRSSFWNRAVLGAASKARIVNVTLSNANYAVADVAERDGRTVTTLVAENGTYSGRQPVVEYNATVTVAESGRVLSLTRSWTSETDRSRTRYVSELAWSPATSVERPGWADDATPVNASQ